MKHVQPLHAAVICGLLAAFTWLAGSVLTAAVRVSLLVCGLAGFACAVFGWHFGDRLHLGDPVALVLCLLVAMVALTTLVAPQTPRALAFQAILILVFIQRLSERC